MCKRSILSFICSTIYLIFCTQAFVMGGNICWLSIESFSTKCPVCLLLLGRSVRWKWPDQAGGGHCCGSAPGHGDRWFGILDLHEKVQVSATDQFSTFLNIVFPSFISIVKNKRIHNYHKDLPNILLSTCYRLLYWILKNVLKARNLEDWWEWGWIFWREQEAGGEAGG